MRNVVRPHKTWACGHICQFQHMWPPAGAGVLSLMHPISPELPISAHVACARVCQQLYARKPRPCPSYSRRRDRNDCVHWRSLYKGGWGYVSPKQGSSHMWEPPHTPAVIRVPHPMGLNSVGSGHSTLQSIGCTQWPAVRFWFTNEGLG